MVLLGIVRRERLLELETRVRGYPTESLFWKDTTTMKKTLSNTAKPVKHKWAKVIAAVEKHTAKKTLRHAHKVELKNFEFDAVFS